MEHVAIEARPAPLEELCAAETPSRLLCAETVTPSASAPRKSLTLSLFVTWTTLGGKTRHNNLTLRRVAAVDELQGLAKDLMTRAFPDTTMPAHLTTSAACRTYYHYTPDQECLSLPSDVARTNLKLVVSYDGWEFVVYERLLRTDPAQPADAAETPLLVTMIEFESTAMVIGHLGIRVQLVSYPMISIRRDFLDDVDFRIRTDPDTFTGILS
ncbi:hypothetical protein CHLRE_04g226500v5 [Chlamydomonas reinhardtii]|uniref:Uncharacterized protein n=1 Tax=Chlamydomonas reinhardtii TaxID=3055 RepID=A0A2K3DUP0_CHLRE|nr:uncharacterized protein CHLRE_04g226500v5 [Chlamydomonas reinhardtii]PNW84244.1 hypothetical protein CHLRE_04g226500v5 [Chlamydomonas reinhardtii]